MFDFFKKEKKNEMEEVKEISNEENKEINSTPILPELVLAADTEDYIYYFKSITLTFDRFDNDICKHPVINFNNKQKFYSLINYIKEKGGFVGDDLNIENNKVKIKTFYLNFNSITTLYLAKPYINEKGELDIETIEIS